MAQHAGFSRLVYNYGLDLFWQSVKAGCKASDSKRLQQIKKCLTNITKKRPEFAWMNTLSSKVYQSAFQDLHKAFSNWRKGVAKKPVFKRLNDCQSFTVYDGNGVVLVKAGKSIKVPTIGTLRLAESSQESYVSQTFTISQEGDGWYISFALFAERIPPILHEVAQAVGIDLGVKVRIVG